MNLPSEQWKILDSEFDAPHISNGLKLEWEYFMIHSAAFTGSIGFVLADPDGKLGGVGSVFKLMPSGASVATAGKFADNGHKFSEYTLFDPLDSEFSKSNKNLSGRPDLQGHWFQNTSDNWSGGGPIHLIGQNANISWDLNIVPEWTDRAKANRAFFPPLTSTAAGLQLLGEHWTVNMTWPRTKVTGHITRTTDNTKFPIDGHGYRENSWGRWSVFFDGWSFNVVSDTESKVQWAWQSYHSSEDLDFVDVSFPHGDGIQHVRFPSYQLKWSYPSAVFDAGARQCVPTSTTIVATNSDYTVTANVDIGANHIAMNSGATWLTKFYFIMTQFPKISGQIVSTATGKVLNSFQGQGGGEFATKKSLFASTNCDSLRGFEHP